METPENKPGQIDDEKFIIVHLGKTRDGVSVLNTRGFATAVKLSEHVRRLVQDTPEKES